MFDFFRNCIFAKIFLAVIAISFVYFGVGSLRATRIEYISQIGDTKITNFDVKNYLQKNRQVQDEENITKAYIFLQKRAYLIEGGKRAGMDISANQINQVIKSEPTFKDLHGNFDIEKYRQFINNVYRFDALFEAELKNNMIFTYLNYYLTNNHIISDYQILQYLAVYDTQKEIQTVQFPIANYKGQVSYTDNDLKSFYQNHQKAYQQGEAIRFEYLHLTPEWRMQQIKISEEDIKSYYKSNQGSNPKRMASHIVLRFPQGGSLDNEVKLNLKKQAELILQKVKQNPQNFSEFAGRYSQDTSTAQFGGSLGLIERNAQYYESIEDAVFSLKTGQIYDQVVETDDGYHIIKVDAAMDWQSYSQDRAGIEYVLKFNKAKESLIAMSDELSEASFNESEDLRKISKNILGQDIVQSSAGWVTKQETLLTGLPVEVIQILFDPMSISDKSNSDVISVGGSYWIVRVTDNRPAQQLSFDEVKQKLINDYTLVKAGELALADAKKIFNQLTAGENIALSWSKPKLLSVEQAKSDFSQEEYIKFLSTNNSQANQPGYYLLDKISQPMIVRVNSEKLDYPFKEEKIKFSFSKARDMISKKNELAVLSYLYSNIKRKSGSDDLDI